MKYEDVFVHLGADHDEDGLATIARKRLQRSCNIVCQHGFWEGEI